MVVYLALAARGESPAAFDVPADELGNHKGCPYRYFPAEFCGFTLHPADVRCSG